MPGLIQVRAGGVAYVVAPPEGALAVGGVVPSAAITATATYPLSVHASGRYLVTPGGTPFLILSGSPHGDARLPLHERDEHVRAGQDRREDDPHGGAHDR